MLTRKASRPGFKMGPRRSGIAESKRSTPAKHDHGEWSGKRVTDATTEPGEMAFPGRGARIVGVTAHLRNQLPLKQQSCIVLRHRPKRYRPSIAAEPWREHAADAPHT